MTGIDWSNCPIVERNPNRMGGVPTVRAYRMAADWVVENWEAGVESEEIAYQFSLPLEDVNIILNYAAKVQRVAHPV